MICDCPLPTAEGLLLGYCISGLSFSNGDVGVLFIFDRVMKVCEKNVVVV